MIDHAVLLERLTCSFGVTGTVHSWIQSYLCGRSQSVRIGGHSSSVTSCSVGVPQGSVLGPLLFFYLHLTSGNNSSSTTFSNSSMQMTHNFMLLCLLPIIVTVLQDFSHVCPHFMLGFAKTVWR